MVVLLVPPLIWTDSPMNAERASLIRLVLIPRRGLVLITVSLDSRVLWSMSLTSCSTCVNSGSGAATTSEFVATSTLSVIFWTSSVGRRVAPPRPDDPPRPPRSICMICSGEGPEERPEAPEAVARLGWKIPFTISATRSAEVNWI